MKNIKQIVNNVISEFMNQGNKFNLIKEGFSSINLYEEISSLTETQIDEISLGIEFISTHIRDSVLIGGSAVVYYLNGGRSLTPDIDFLVAYIEETKDILLDNNIDFDNIVGDYGNIGITIPDFNIDLLDKKSGNIHLNELILKNYVTGNFGGIKVKIIEPELLYIMKLELGRDKDVSDGFALASEKGLLNKEKVMKYLNLLGTKLKEYESIVMYIDLIK